MITTYQNTEVILSQQSANDLDISFSRGNVPHSEAQLSSIKTQNTNDRQNCGSMITGIDTTNKASPPNESELKETRQPAG